MILLNPGAPALDGSLELAPRRFTSMEGLRLGLLGNSKLNADNILEAVGELLQERYSIASVLHNKKPSFSHPAPDAMRDEMVANCDVVIAGVGDWGSCSAASVADGAIFEKNGVVAASIITNPFRVTADSMAKRHGYPGYRYAVMPHPIGNLRSDQVRQRAEEVLPQVLSILGLPEHIQPK